MDIISGERSGVFRGPTPINEWLGQRVVSFTGEQPVVDTADPQVADTSDDPTEFTD